MEMLNFKHEAIPEWLQIDEFYEELPEQKVVVEARRNGSWDIVVYENGEEVERETGFTRKEDAIRVAKLFSQKGEVTVKTAALYRKSALHPGMHAYIDGNEVTILNVDDGQVEVLFQDGHKETVSEDVIENPHVHNEKGEVITEEEEESQEKTSSDMVPTVLGTPGVREEESNPAIETGREKGPGVSGIEVPSSPGNYSLHPKGAAAEEGSGLGVGGPPRKGKPKTDKERLEEHFGKETAKKLLDLIGEEAYKLLPERGEKLEGAGAQEEKTPSGLGVGGPPRRGKPKTEKERLEEHFGKELADLLVELLGDRAFELLPPRGTGLSRGKTAELAPEDRDLFEDYFRAMGKVVSDEEWAALDQWFNGLSEEEKDEVRGMVQTTVEEMSQGTPSEETVEAALEFDDDELNVTALEIEEAVTAAVKEVLSQEEELEGADVLESVLREIASEEVTPDNIARWTSVLETTQFAPELQPFADYLDQRLNGEEAEPVEVPSQFESLFEEVKEKLPESAAGTMTAAERVLDLVDDVVSSEKPLEAFAEVAREHSLSGLEIFALAALVRDNGIDVPVGGFLVPEKFVVKKGEKEYLSGEALVAMIPTLGEVNGFVSLDYLFGVLKEAAENPFGQLRDQTS